MRNETRMMFVENQGADGVPMKVVASYSHTIQHPGSKSPEEKKLQFTIAEPHISVRNATHYVKPIQKVAPSSIQSQASKLVNKKPRMKEQQPPPPQQQEQQQLPQPQQQQQQQLPSPSQQLQPPPQQFQQSSRQPQPLPPPQQQMIPFFLIPTETEHSQDGSLNSYAQLLQNLYGTAVNKYSPLAPGTNYKKEYT
ncbi:hypothetical protein B7P43_G04351, partial [Cryptotermes secundus]